MGRNKAERLQRQGKCVISDDGKSVTMCDTASRREILRQSQVAADQKLLGYDIAANKGLLTKKEMRDLPMIGPNAFIRLMTKT